MKPFVETSHALPLVHIAIGFRSGSAYDPEGREGLARVTARMLRRGSEALGAEEIEDAIDRIGGEVGADATTSATWVHGEVIKRNLAPFAELVRDILGTPRFDGDELGRLVRQTQAELIEARDSDRSLASRAFRRALFERHPYGRRITGTTASLGTIAKNDAHAFHRRHFCRENAVMAVSGDIDAKEADDLASLVLSRLPAGERVADVIPEPTKRVGRELVLVNKPDRTQTQMVVGGLGSSSHDADHFDLLVGNTVFGGTFTSRLTTEVRGKRGWSYGASSVLGLDRRREAFAVWTAPSVTDAPACLALELELLQTLREGGVTEDEIAFAKNYLRRSHAFEVDTAKKRVHQKLDEALYDLPDGYHDKHLERVAATTLAGVNEALARRIPNESIVVAVVGAETELRDKLEKSIPDLDRVTVLPFEFEG